MLDDSPPFSCKDHPSALQIDARTSGNALVLALRGEADAAAAPMVSHALTQASTNGHRRLAIDLADLEFIDSHCLSVLFDTHEILRNRGGDLVLRSPQPAVRRLLDILQRDDLIEL
jgi:anti-anti-sigma factor